MTYSISETAWVSWAGTAVTGLTLAAVGIAEPAEADASAIASPAASQL